MPPVGRTTVGSPSRKTALGVGIALAVALMAIASSVVLLRRARLPVEETQGASAAAGPAAPSQAVWVDPPKVTLAAPIPPTTLDPQRRHPRQRPSAAPEPAATTKRKAPNVQAPAAPASPKVAPAASPAASAPPVAPAPAAPPAAKCDPPYYFDANGNRMFKKECGERVGSAP